MGRVVTKKYLLWAQSAGAQSVGCAQSVGGRRSRERSNTVLRVMTDNIKYPINVEILHKVRGGAVNLALVTRVALSCMLDFLCEKV